MKNRETPTTPVHNADHPVDTIETVDLEQVTGGCARCGCGQPDAVAAQASLWQQR